MECLSQQAVYLTKSSLDCLKYVAPLYLTRADISCLGPIYICPKTVGQGSHGQSPFPWDWLETLIVSMERVAWLFLRNMAAPSQLDMLDLLDTC